MQLTLGANMAVPTDQLELQIQVSPRANFAGAVDAAAYLLGIQQKVRGDDDMVFYGQTHNQNRSVQWQNNSSAQQTFSIQLNQIDQAIDKIALTASFDQQGITLGHLQQIDLRLLHKGQLLATARIDGESRPEAALILAEFYRRQGAWKFRVVGQGFNGGLKPLSEHFGVDISDSPTLKPAPAKPAAPTPPAAVPPPKASVSLSKIRLDKAQPKVSLAKRGQGFGEIRVNLNWNKNGAKPASGGFFAKLMQSSKTDLDLGCMYELQDGQKGVVQALGNTFGDFNRAPYIVLLGDDRTGAVQDGEWLRINGQEWAKIKRILVYAFIYEGAANWAATDGMVTIYAPDQAPIEVQLSEGDSSKGMCAVLMLENQGGALNVTREVRYFSGHKPTDQHYGFGFRWTIGSKD